MSIERPPGPPPDVTVIIPVYNVEPYLRQCLDSVVSQSIGPDRLEVIAVDDGSTDGSGAILDEYAARHQSVVALHQPNSGGPGGPRNVAMERATGRYVFFVDGDDYLGTEALERLVAMADRNESDVVLGRLVGIEGRPSPMSMFRANVDRADLCTDHVYRTLSPLKLFRRALLDRLALRFPEGIGSGEDQPFTARAYFGARTISILADYVCYYARLRPGSQTQTIRGREQFARIDRFAELMDLVGTNVPAGRCRDTLMERHVTDLLRSFGRGWADLDAESRSLIFGRARDLVLRWHTDAIQQRLEPPFGLRAYCLQHDLLQPLVDIARMPRRRARADAIADAEHVYAAYPHFRDEVGIPDSCFEITSGVRLRHRVHDASVRGDRLRLRGHAYLSQVGGTVDVVLRERRRGREAVLPVTSVPTPELRDRNDPYPRAGFDVDVDLRTARAGEPLPAGTWDVLVRVSYGEFRRSEPVRVDGARLRGDEPPPEDGTYRLQESHGGRVALTSGTPSRVVRAVDALHVVGGRARSAVTRTLRRVAALARGRRRP